MYIFGGRTNNDEVLNDLWSLDLTQYTWTKIDNNQMILDTPPLGRTGHSCDIVGNTMVVFGGFYKVAKELNDMHIFDFDK